MPPTNPATRPQEPAAGKTNPARKDRAVRNPILRSRGLQESPAYGSRSALRTAAALLFEPLTLTLFPGDAALRQAERVEQAHVSDAEQRNPEPHGDAALHEFDGIDDARDSQHHQYEAQKLHKIGFHVNPHFG